MRKWIAIAGALLLIAVGIYVGSPYYAIYSLRNAALEADTDELEAGVDFPAVRDSLKSQMSAAMMTKMQNDPEMRNNPFAGLGAMMMPAIVDRMVDSFVTPDGIAAMMRGQKPTDRAKAQANPDIESRTEYVNLNRFRVRLHNKKSNEDGPSLLLERRGFATWKLIKLEIPAGLLDDKQ
ncbi:MAG: hypothetical protein QOJ91_1679 [Sphingomonadales bacterium]|jgi:hypothetical protein|nr:hypothetical protein [Sphingomonadales bacterium]